MEGSHASEDFASQFYDVLENLGSGMSHEEILREFPYLTDEDIRACLVYAADRERKLELQKA